MRKANKAELLSPAGNAEKLEAAVRYGADAVYLAGKQFGMRAASDNFTAEELGWAVQYCHQRGVKLYVTVNAFPTNREIEELGDYAQALKNLGADAVINVRYTSSSVMQSASEILAYGTAVRYL